MNENSQLSPELTALFNAFVNEDISDDQMARLEVALRNNSAAQDELLAFSQLHIDLTVEFGADRAAKTFCERQSRFARVATPLLALAPKDVSPSVAPTSLANKLKPGSSRRSAIGGLTACAALAIATFLWSGFLSRDDESSPTSPDAIESSHAPTVTSIQLGPDVAEIGLEKIGRVTIRYPADFRLVGPMRARLNHGQIKVQVTEETGRGFVVETPDGEVTDLGTEFGLDVREGEQTGLVVVDGKVDLRVATTHVGSQASALERLVKGDGVLFKKDNSIARIMSVISDEQGLFRSASALPPSSSNTIIAEVVDNLAPSDTKQYYEIVPGGLREDALSYVDRLEHNWNGVDRWGMPAYLLGADYVKTFNDDKHKDKLSITLALTRPAKVYVFLDDRIEPPEWLKKNFRNMGDKLGMDTGARVSLREKKYSYSGVKTGVGSGVSIDNTFTIWERVVDRPGSLKLGPNGAPKVRKHVHLTSMYGIAASEWNETSRGGD